MLSLYSRTMRLTRLSSPSISAPIRNIPSFQTLPHSIPRTAGLPSHPDNPVYAQLSRQYRTRASYQSDPWSLSFTRAMWTLIGLNTAIFGLWQYARLNNSRPFQRWMTLNFTASWLNWKLGRYWTIVSSSFSHIQIGHFLFNMLAFHAFASYMAAVPGIAASRAFTLYLGSACASSAGTLVHHQGKNASLGASGAVMAFGVATSCLMPKAPIMVFFVPMPLWVATLGYVTLDIFSLDSGDNVGHAAHLGGAAFGALYYVTSLRKYGGILR